MDWEQHSHPSRRVIWARPCHSCFPLRSIYHNEIDTKVYKGVQGNSLFRVQASGTAEPPSGKASAAQLLVPKFVFNSLAIRDDSIGWKQFLVACSSRQVGTQSYANKNRILQLVRQQKNKSKHKHQERLDAIEVGVKLKFGRECYNFRDVHFQLVWHHTEIELLSLPFSKLSNYSANC